MPSETTDAKGVIYSSRETKESKQAAAEYYQEKLKKAVAEFVEHPMEPECTCPKCGKDQMGTDLINGKCECEAEFIDYLEHEKIKDEHRKKQRPES